MDVSNALEIVSGRTALMQAIARRLVTPRGGLFYDADYGYDVRQFLSGNTVGVSAIASQVEAEAEKDERVAQVSAKVTVSGSQILVRLAVADGGGPFVFTLAISNVTATILTQG
jgi:uncharacterized membrane protein